MTIDTSLQAFKDFAYNHDGVDNKRVLAVVKEDGEKVLRVIDLHGKGWWQKRKLRGKADVYKVALFVAQKLREADSNSPWWDTSDQVLKRRYAWLDKQVRDFHNPLPERLHLRITWPSVGVLDEKLLCKECTIEYGQLDTVAKVREKIEKQFRNLPLEWRGKKQLLPGPCFKHVESEDDVLSFTHFVEVDGVRNAWRYLRELPQNTLHIDLGFDEDKLYVLMRTRGRRAGFQRGWITGRSRDEAVPPRELIDEELAQEDHFDSTGFYDGFIEGYKMGYRGGRAAYHQHEDCFACCFPIRMKTYFDEDGNPLEIPE